jgi:hypothetical protein
MEGKESGLEFLNLRNFKNDTFINSIKKVSKMTIVYCLSLLSNIKVYVIINKKG